MKWFEISGLDGMYLINKQGQVKVKERKWVTGRWVERVKEEHIIKPFMKRNGYLHINLRHEGKQVQFPLHILLARTFMPNPENKKCVNHIDGNKLNNNLKNLEWATYKENNNHALTTGIRVNPSGINNGYSQPVEVVKGDSVIGKYASLKEAAKILNIQYDRLYKISKGMVLKTDYKIRRITKDEYLQ